MGYPATTGLQAIDYRFTDEILNPPGEPSNHVESLYRLPCGSACFSPPVVFPDVVELPAIKNGYVTFGSPHSLAKINDRVVQLWSQTLQAVRGSRLLMFRDSLRGDVAESFRQRFRRAGVSDERLDIRSTSGRDGGYIMYLEKYNEIDICLDTFPANAGATCFESLYMGVPWLTIYGDRFFSRQTASVETRLGLCDWVAHDDMEFVQKAVHWSQHVAALAQIRMGLRTRFRQTTVGDPVSFARGLEAAYREIVMG
jgi:predicted O-linked N-acetylglucosamine transferase (SPINDLY family)